MLGELSLPSLCEVCHLAGETGRTHTLTHDAGRQLGLCRLDSNQTARAVRRTGGSPGTDTQWMKARDATEHLRPTGEPARSGAGLTQESAVGGGEARLQAPSPVERGATATEKEHIWRLTCCFKGRRDLLNPFIGA